MFDDYYLSFNLCSEIFRSPLSMDFSLSIDSRIDGGISRISIEIKMVAYTRTRIRENYCNIRANYTRWLICRSTRQFFDSSWQNFYFSSYQWTRNFWEYWKYIINCDIRRLICRVNLCSENCVAKFHFSFFRSEEEFPEYYEEISLIFKIQFIIVESLDLSITSLKLFYLF